MLLLQSDIYWVNCTQEPSRHRVPCHRKERNRSQSFQGIRLSHEQLFFLLKKRIRLAIRVVQIGIKLVFPKKLEYSLIAAYKPPFDNLD